MKFKRKRRTSFYVVTIVSDKLWINLLFKLFVNDFKKRYIFRRVTLSVLDHLKVGIVTIELGEIFKK